MTDNHNRDNGNLVPTATTSDRAIRAMKQPDKPQGDRLAGYAGPGTLRPGVGKLVQRTGAPHYCGAMVGMVMAASKHPNSRDQSRTSTKFVGDCISVQFDGRVQQVGEFYLPPTLTRIIEASLGLGGGVAFSVEIWCEPDAEGRTPSPLGYSYVTYNRRPRPANDPVLALAYASGLIEMPEDDVAARLKAIEDKTFSSIDPETGEEIGSSAAAADELPARNGKRKSK